LDKNVKSVIQLLSKTLYFVYSDSSSMWLKWLSDIHWLHDYLVALKGERIVAKGERIAKRSCNLQLLEV